MSWYAIEAIDKAIKDTKELLLPFNLGTWLRLALIVIFTGAGIGFVNPVNFVPSDFDKIDEVEDTRGPADLSDNNSLATESSQNAVTGLATSSSSLSNAAWAILGLFLVGLVVLIFYLSSVFEFIYYQSLLDKDVSIRENFRKHWLNGLQYFVFEIVYLLGIAALIIAIIGGFVVNPVLGIFNVFLGISAFIILAVFSGLVHDFALLQMIDGGEGLILSWRSIWPELRDQWREIAVYLVVKFGIGIAISIAVTTLIVGLLIPFIFLFGIIAVLLSLVADVLVLIPLLAGIITFGVVMLGVIIAARTFVYFFIIEVFHQLTS